MSSKTSPYHHTARTLHSIAIELQRLCDNHEEIKMQVHILYQGHASQPASLATNETQALPLPALLGSSFPPEALGCTRDNSWGSLLILIAPLDLGCRMDDSLQHKLSLPQGNQQSAFNNQQSTVPYHTHKHNNNEFPWTPATNRTASTSGSFMVRVPLTETPASDV